MNKFPLSTVIKDQQDIRYQLKKIIKNHEKLKRDIILSHDRHVTRKILLRDHSNDATPSNNLPLDFKREEWIRNYIVEDHRDVVKKKLTALKNEYFKDSNIADKTPSYDFQKKMSRKLTRLESSYVKKK